MALLTNTDLNEIVIDNIDSATENNLVIVPFEKANLTPVGYDLRVGKSYVIDSHKGELSENSEFKIDSKKMALIHTLEEIGMPPNKTLSALIHSKVSLSCKGLSNISTTVDADWTGNLLIAVYNNSNKAISLKYGESFCTISFIENKSPAKAGRYAKPNKRTDILENSFAESYEENKKHPLLSLFLHCIPPIIPAFSLYAAYSNFKENSFMIRCNNNSKCIFCWLHN